MLKITFHNTASISFYEPSTGITIGAGDTTINNVKDSKLESIKQSIQKMNTSNNSTYVTLDYEKVETQNTITPNQKGIVLDELDTIEVSVALSSDLWANNNEWSTSDDSVLSVSGYGNKAIVKALKESDASSIIVKNGDNKAFFNVKVYPKLEGLKINPASKNIGVNSTYQFSLSPIPSTARILTPIWSSNNNNVASVDSGLVKAKALGKCNITGSYKGYSVSSEIDVTDKYTASFLENSKSISVGESYNAVLTVTKNNVAFTDIKPKYSSSDNSIASIDSSGKITGLSQGKVIISAYEDSKYSTSIEVIVSVVLISSINMSPSSLNLYAGNEQVLTTEILPSNATNKNLTFKSDNTEVATVNSLGKVTPKNVGVANITASSNDGTFIHATTVLTVLETQVTSISLNQATQNLEVGNVFQLVANILPATATNKTITWSTTNSNCAVVDNSGLVTAVSSGNATIVATSNEGRKNAICVVTVNSSQ